MGFFKSLADAIKQGVKDGVAQGKANNTKNADVAFNTVQENDIKTPKNEERHRVTGISYSVENVEKLATPNPEYNWTKKQLFAKYPDGKDIYEYVFNYSTVELVPEPDNPHDEKAIKVVIDGLHVGYIKKGACAHIHNLLKNNSIKGISANIYGGNYKEFIAYDYEGNKPKLNDFELNKESGSYKVDITIKLV